jgi:hypothetical protein
MCVVCKLKKKKEGKSKNQREDEMKKMRKIRNKSVGENGVQAFSIPVYTNLKRIKKELRITEYCVPSLCRSHASHLCI